MVRKKMAVIIQRCKESQKCDFIMATVFERRRLKLVGQRRYFYSPGKQAQIKTKAPISTAVQVKILDNFEVAITVGE